MAKTPRTLAREQIVQAAESAQDELSACGAKLAPLDILKIAADFAARYAVMGARTGTRCARDELADQLRKEFVARVVFWEDYLFGGGETIVISKDPKIVVRAIELFDVMLDPPRKKRGRPRPA